MNRILGCVVVSKLVKICLLVTLIFQFDQRGWADVFEDATPKELAKWRLANQAAGKRLFQDLKTLSKSRNIERVMLVDLIATKMRQDIARHRIREESRSLSKTYAREARWGFP